jgi:hypothetical protein
MNLFEKPPGVQTRWASFENPSAGRGCAAQENRGSKGHAFDNIPAGQTKTLLDVTGSGMITRIWLTINDRTPEMLRGTRIDMYWDGAEKAAVSCPLGDFFGTSLGRRTKFECALFSDPEGRSFNCFIPMPFRQGARVTLTNETGTDLARLFYDIDLLVDVPHSAETLYFHAHWRRETPNQLGQNFVILPRVPGVGRFLGCNAGIITNPIYDKAWWGEGEVKVWFGSEKSPTLCGTGAEDYLGTAWGQGAYAHRTQGCLIADDKRRHWSFYRYHVDDPIYFEDGCEVAIQTIGGWWKKDALVLLDHGAPMIPVSIDLDKMIPVELLAIREQPVDLHDPTIPAGWCNFWRQDDWSATSYFYLDSPAGVLPPIAPPDFRTRGLEATADASARADG